MPPPRRFRAFCVGLPKTGTTSIGTIFESYRSHKVAGSELERLGCDLRDGRASEDEARAFIARRDAEEQLEMDPASANWMVAGLLRDTYPEAKFILTLRDCYSWCDSMINVVLVRDMGVHFVDHPEILSRMLGCELDWFRDEATVLSRSDAILDNLLGFWARQADTLGQCPAARTLVVRTNEISSSLDAMADFVGVPRGSLLPAQSHSRITAVKFDILGRLDRDYVRHRFAAHATSDVMKRYFPGVSLESFLEKSARSRGRAPAAPRDSRANTSPPSAPPPVADVQLAAVQPPEHPAEVRSARGFREIADAVEVIRAQAARGLPRRFGYSLDQCTIKTRDGLCYAVMSFVGPHRLFVLELALRDALEGHWLATDRFAICYRKNTPARVQGDLQLAQKLLETIEGQVGRPGSERKYP
jgi:hypothetical protein